MFRTPRLSVQRRSQTLAFPFFACLAFDMAVSTVDILLEIVMNIKGRKKTRPIIATLTDLQTVLQHCMADIRVTFMTLDRQQRSFAEAALLLKDDDVLIPLMTLSENLRSNENLARRIPSRTWLSFLTGSKSSDATLDQINGDLDCIKRDFFERVKPMMSTLLEVFHEASRDPASQQRDRLRRSMDARPTSYLSRYKTVSESGSSAISDY